MRHARGDLAQSGKPVGLAQAIAQLGGLRLGRGAFLDFTAEVCGTLGHRSLQRQRALGAAAVASAPAPYQRAND